MKKFILAAFAIIVVAVGLFLAFARIPYVDYFNPFLKKETSYAVVPLGTQTYVDIQAYDESGEPLKYRLNFGGYDARSDHVKVIHKGKYVFQIEYIHDLSKWPKEVKKKE
ncbi:YxeA family protein [Staphylococcus pseudintermedius]|nr:YxeA family protein [Staphylococcus pseudintermedius]MDE9974779.1 YxeA family protein [Staphylococcus pseudintermedius]MDE9977181.1 YxeA family protein [Staphylococcus pseudintermedius]MDE9996225.1 YxeA family protein [Staphylococcus pseudintermedius]